MVMLTVPLLLSTVVIAQVSLYVNETEERSD